MAPLKISELDDEPAPTADDLIAIVNDLAGTPVTKRASLANLAAALAAMTGVADAFSPKALTLNAQTGTAYTLVLTDAQRLVECSNAGAITLTVPPNSSVAFPVGTQVHVLQTGAGQVTVVGDTGVTVNGTPGLKARAQWSALTLIKRAGDAWVAVGDLAA